MVAAVISVRNADASNVCGMKAGCRATVVQPNPLMNEFRVEVEAPHDAGNGGARFGAFLMAPALKDLE